METCFGGARLKLQHPQHGLQENTGLLLGHSPFWKSSCALDNSGFLLLEILWEKLVRDVED